MKPPVFEHHLPKTLHEALRCLKVLENARILAGGQSLMPMLNLRLAYPDHLIDLNGISDLAYIQEDQGEVLIGAMTLQRSIEFSDLVARKLPLLSEALLSVGHRQTRNRGTLGGSLCHLDPAAELPVVAAAFEATLTVADSERVRTVDFGGFALDLMTPGIEEDEILVEVRFTPWSDGHGWAFSEYSRRTGDFAIVAAAAMIDLNEEGHICRAALALGGVRAVPVRMADAERELIGHQPTSELFDRASSRCSAIEPMDDSFVPGWYRRKLAPFLARRVLDVAYARAQAAGEK